MSTLPVLGSPTESRMDQVREWMSPLNVHVAVGALLLLANLWLLVHLVILGFGGGASGAQAVIDARAQQATADLAARPLRGLDTKLLTSQEQAKHFYTSRLPYGYADVATELGALRQRTGVRLSRGQYVQAAPVNGLTEVRMDYALTGEYKPLALFINGLERDRMFFLIQNITLSGQQNGLVNLRLRIGTYLREPMPGLATAQAESGSRP